MDIKEEWKRATSREFWAEIAPCEHVVQIYEKDEEFMQLLAQYAIDGIEQDDCVLIIATANHLAMLREALMTARLDVDRLLSSGQLIALDAEESLAKFMVNGWPDENLFFTFVRAVFERSRAQRRQLRAFGEMVAILWAQGAAGATVHLEHLWNKFIHSETLTLFCAYPLTGLTRNPESSMLEICKTHSKIISGADDGNVAYKTAAPGG